MTPGAPKTMEVVDEPVEGSMEAQRLEKGHPRFRRQMYLVAMAYFVESAVGPSAEAREVVQCRSGTSGGAGSSETPF